MNKLNMVKIPIGISRLSKRLLKLRVISTLYRIEGYNSGLLKRKQKYRLGQIFFFYKVLFCFNYQHGYLADDLLLPIGIIFHALFGLKCSMLTFMDLL
jgi:hypothetical protein